jgi:hypothetical protein
MSESTVAERAGTDTGPDTFIEHWVKARIDSPLAMIVRTDEAAKQLIAVAGVLEAVLFVIVKLDDSGISPRVASLAVTAGVALLITIGLAAMLVCLQPRDLNASDVYLLLNHAKMPDRAPQDLSAAICKWCGGISGVARAKQALLAIAAIMLLVSLSASVMCVYEAVHARVEKTAQR